MSSKLKKGLSFKSQIIISDRVKSHANDPYVLKKNEAARRLLERCPPPKELLQKK